MREATRRRRRRRRRETAVSEPRGCHNSIHSTFPNPRFAFAPCCCSIQLNRADTIEQAGLPPGGVKDRVGTSHKPSATFSDIERLFSHNTIYEEHAETIQGGYNWESLRVPVIRDRHTAAEFRNIRCLRSMGRDATDSNTNDPETAARSGHGRFGFANPLAEEFAPWSQSRMKTCSKPFELKLETGSFSTWSKIALALEPG